MIVKFNEPYIAPKVYDYVKEVVANRNLGIEGKYSTLCEDWLQKKLRVRKVILTQSCTAALEFSVRLTGSSHGDEVILPAFTYVSTANCVVMAGAKPVFVDIEKESLNIAVNKIEESVTTKTKVMICVHYGGFPCRLKSLIEICDRYNLVLIEDSAHSTGGTIEKKSLGTFGKLGTLSFHETKNITSGQGGALLINDDNLIDKAYVLSQKGTDRKHFLDGNVGKYTWKDIGSSWIMSELHAAVLWSQLENFECIQNTRQKVWILYHNLLRDLEQVGYLTRPLLDLKQQNSFHNYFVILDDRFSRESVLQRLVAGGVYGVSHYEPLHLSEAGRRFAPDVKSLPNTERVSKSLIRLPFHHYIKPIEQEYVVSKLTETLEHFQQK